MATRLLGGQRPFPGLLDTPLLLTDNHLRDVVFVHTYPARLSDAERDRALKALGDGLSPRAPLARHVRPPDGTGARRPPLRRTRRAHRRPARRGTWSKLVFGAVEAISGFTVRLRRAWQAERLPKLLLPHPGNDSPADVPRPASGLRLNHDGLPHLFHAELSRQGGLWVLRDLGSTNGTTVNGRRVISAAVVKEGDQISSDACPSASRPPERPTRTRMSIGLGFTRDFLEFPYVRRC